MPRPTPTPTSRRANLSGADLRGAGLMARQRGQARTPSAPMVVLSKSSDVRLVSAARAAGPAGLAQKATEPPLLSDRMGSVTLENRCTLARTVGSNPTPTASFSNIDDVV